MTMATANIYPLLLFCLCKFTIDGFFLQDATPNTCVTVCGVSGTLHKGSCCCKRLYLGLRCDETNAAHFDFFCFRTWRVHGCMSTSGMFQYASSSRLEWSLYYSMQYRMPTRQDNLGLAWLVTSYLPNDPHIRVSSLETVFQQQTHSSSSLLSFLLLTLCLL